MRDIISEVNLEDSADILKFYAIELYKIKNLMVEGRVIQAHNALCKLAVETSKGMNAVNSKKDTDGSS